VWIKTLQLEAFRNYQQLAVNLTPGVNLIVGKNGAGKTNLAEACVFLSELESHRTANNSPLIRSGANTAQLSLKAVHQNREVAVAGELNREKPNRYYLNGSQQKRASDLVGAVQVVVFAPEDLDLVRRDPADRRGFLNMAMVMQKPRLAGVKADYERVLKQKSALLKSAKQVKNPDLTTLDIWDDQLVALGSEIIAARLDLIDLINPLLEDFYQKLSGQQEAVELGLAASIVNLEEDGGETLKGLGAKEIAEVFHQRLTDLREKELDRGIALVGPHRDELMILKDGLSARTHSSQGEAWSLALGLKLALADLIRKDSNTGDPILILDDVFAVLDSGRRTRLVEFVSANEQVIITSADPDAVPKLTIANQLFISGGELVEGN
jgi:DNA replication and repair protein RecF